MINMAFQLKPKQQTENKTIRFPLPLVERIEEAIENQDITFSRFVILACEYALQDIEKGNTSRTTYHKSEDIDK